MTVSVRRALWPAAALMVLVTACNGSDPIGDLNTIPTDQFIDTYVELRITALRNPTGEITAAQRDSVLDARGVRSDQMVEFAEVHGRRATFMQAVWDSVEVRFHRTRDALNQEAVDSAT